MPSSPEEFREFAQECLRWAGETKSERHRQALLEMARTWIQAALEVERSGLRSNAHFGWLRGSWENEREQCVQHGGFETVGGSWH